MFPVRWIIAFLGMYSVGLMFMHRAGMSVAIIQIANRKVSDGNTSLPEKSFLLNQTKQSEKLEWSETLQGIILGSSFYLYVFVPTIAGNFTDSIGGMWFAFVGVLGPAILCAIIPFVIDQMGAIALIVVQTLIGGFHGLTYPAFISLYIQWFPNTERPIANAGIQVGNAFGNALTFFVAGELCESSIGWPLVFYAISAFHVPWLFIWLYFGSNKPFESKRISDVELKYITSNNMQQTKQSVANFKTPWLQICTSGAVLASTISKMTCGFAFFLLLSKLPTYLVDIFELPIASIGRINSAATFALGVSCLFSAPLSNWIIKRTCLSNIAVRKLFQFICSFGSAVSLALIPTFDTNLTMCIALLIIGMFLYGFLTGGEWTLVTDYAQTFAGMVTGLCSILAFSTGIASPYFVGYILDSDIGTKTQKWNLIFYTTSVLLIIGNLIFCLLATDKRQPWDIIPAQQKTNSIENP